MTCVITFVVHRSMNPLPAEGSYLRLLWNHLDRSEGLIHGVVNMGTQKPSPIASIWPTGRLSHIWSVQWDQVRVVPNFSLWPALFFCFPTTVPYSSSVRLLHGVLSSNIPFFFFFKYFQSKFDWLHRCRTHGYGGLIVFHIKMFFKGFTVIQLHNQCTKLQLFQIFTNTWYSQSF